MLTVSGKPSSDYHQVLTPKASCMSGIEMLTQNILALDSLSLPIFTPPLFTLVYFI